MPREKAKVQTPRPLRLKVLQLLPSVHQLGGRVLLEQLAELLKGCSNHLASKLQLEGSSIMDILPGCLASRLTKQLFAAFTSALKIGSSYFKEL